MKRNPLIVIPIGLWAISCTSEPSGSASEVPGFVAVDGTGAPGQPGEPPSMGSTVPGAQDRGGSEDRAAGAEAGLEESPSVREILAVSDPANVPDGVAIMSRFRRLTHSEYDRAVADLVRLDVGLLSAEFPEELPTLQGYYAPGALGATERLFNALRNAAESIAARVVADEVAYDQVVDCAGADAGCRDSFIAAFGRRAYRRPLTEAELTSYRALFEAAGAWSPADGAFRGGVQAVLEAILQSPNFLYRVERGTSERDEFGVRLSSWEVATRLAFMITGTVPDDELLDAAAAGELSTPASIATHAGRLVDNPSVQGRVLDFHSRWAQLNDLDRLAKDVSVFPQFSPQVASSMLQSTERFITEVTLTSNGALQALLTAPFGFVDQNLAPIYELSGAFGPELQRVEFDPGSARGGLLTQPSFLAGHSSSDSGTSPILRGVFVLRRLLCQPIPDPPPNAQSTVPPPSPTPIVTTREYFEWKTGMAACQGCHSVINPIGFAFEDFDGIGTHRTTEKDAPVDASGAVTLSSAMLSFVGGRELAEQLAELPEAQACYAQNWLRYALGRADTIDDLKTLAVLRRGLADPEYGVRDVLVEITQSAAFSHLNDSAK
jgi:hypothetical protein